MWAETVPLKSHGAGHGAEASLTATSVTYGASALWVGLLCCRPPGPTSSLQLTHGLGET